MFQWSPLLPESPTLTGTVTITGPLAHTGVSAGFNGSVPVAKAGAVATPTAPGVVYAQAEAAAMKTAVDAIRVALTNVGITS